MTDTADIPAGTPNRLWYVAHLFFGILSGIICFIVWKKDNRRMANRHLIISLPLSVIAFFLLEFLIILFVIFLE